MREELNKCQLCGIECDLTKHHLIPQSRIRNKYKSIKEDPSNLLWICRSCHDQIHSLFDESQLRDLYNTKEKLISQNEMKKFIEWKKKHPNFTGHSKMSNRRKK
jgi:hypothetical protein